ncbi:hypothetical protein IPH67_05650 [bacterium]|nr:MAG: hypothetical protein IPH67_05650 [bacterium]
MNRNRLFFLYIVLTFHNFFINIYAMSDQNKELIRFILEQQVIQQVTLNCFIRTQESS